MSRIIGFEVEARLLPRWRLHEGELGTAVRTLGIPTGDSKPERSSRHRPRSCLENSQRRAA
jgi:hypothetical protein